MNAPHTPSPPLPGGQSLGNHRVAIRNFTVVTQPAEATDETDKEGITQTRFKGKREQAETNQETTEKYKNTVAYTKIIPDSGNTKLYTTLPFPLGHTPSTKIEK
jgi:hypothetical protein